MEQANLLINIICAAGGVIIGVILGYVACVIGDTRYHRRIVALLMLSYYREFKFVVDELVKPGMALEREILGKRFLASALDNVKCTLAGEGVSGKEIHAYLAEEDEKCES